MSAVVAAASTPALSQSGNSNNTDTGDTDTTIPGGGKKPLLDQLVILSLNVLNPLAGFDDPTPPASSNPWNLSLRHQSAAKASANMVQD
jgi:hypothetical protein